MIYTLQLTDLATHSNSLQQTLQRVFLYYTIVLRNGAIMTELLDVVQKLFNEHEYDSKKMSLQKHCRIPSCNNKQQLIVQLSGHYTKTYFMYRTFNPDETTIGTLLNIWVEFLKSFR